MYFNDTNEKGAQAIDADGATYKVGPKRVHLHVELGVVDAKTFEDLDSQPNALIAECDAAGARVHAVDGPLLQPLRN
jgi:hypothetical protein